jgi:4-hydroxy-3-methylbut-2-enyl diphosphate reductase
MRVLLANPRGFCAGVEMAIEALEQALARFGRPLYVFHEIVHNTHVVQRFRALGAIFVDDVRDVPEGACLLYSAHGVAPTVRRIAAQRRLRTIDATCPLVAKVHREAARYSRAGYQIVLIGHAGHDEVTGTLGEAPHATVLAESPDDVDRLTVRGHKVAYLTQTTLSVDDAQRVITRLKARFPGAEGPPREDICYATQNRQEAMRTLAREATVAVVVGSPNSSNSRRLVEVAADAGVPAHLVDGADELDMTWFKTTDVVLLTAGASVPATIVDECVACLRARFDAAVEERTVRDERVFFPLPRELR